MPVKIRKLPNKSLYTVKNEITGKVYSKGSTKANATKQARLLNALDKKK